MNQYLIYAWDGTDPEALTRRMAARPDHFRQAAKLKSAGNLIIGGAILNQEQKMVGSVMIVQFESERGLNDWLAIEPYILGKVWVKWEVHPYRVAEVQ
jgi:uncharacterized protein YciI